MADGQLLNELLRSIDADPTVRPWAIEDAEQLVDAWHDPDIARWNGVPAEPTLELARRWTRGASQQRTTSRSIDVVSAAGGVVRGEAGLVIDHARSMAEVGFWVGAAHRRTGVGRLLLDTAARLTQELGLARVVAVTDARNGAAIALLECVGWPEVATTTTERRAFAAPVRESA